VEQGLQTQEARHGDRETHDLRPAARGARIAREVLHCQLPRDDPRRARQLVPRDLQRLVRGLLRTPEADRADGAGAAVFPETNRALVWHLRQVRSVGSCDSDSFNRSHGGSSLPVEALLLRFLMNKI
jgi:hypothetical protein